MRLWYCPNWYFREVQIWLPLPLLIPIFTESDLSIGQTRLIWLAERWIKVVVAVVEVKSEPLFCILEYTAKTAQVATIVFWHHQKNFNMQQADIRMHSHDLRQLVVDNKFGQSTWYNSVGRLSTDSLQDDCLNLLSTDLLQVVWTGYNKPANSGGHFMKYWGGGGECQGPCKIYMSVPW